MAFSLVNLDGFGSTIGFKHNSNFTNKSTLGVCFTFIFLAILSFFLAFYGKRYLNSEEMVVESLDVRYEESQNLTLNNSLVYAFRSEYDGLFNDADNEIFTLKSYYIKVVKGKTVTKRELEKVNCSSYDWSYTQTQYDNLDLKNGLCFNTTGLQINGSRQTNNYSYIRNEFYLNFGNDAEANNSLLEYLDNNPANINFHMLDTIFTYNSTFQGSVKYMKTIGEVLYNDLLLNSDVYFSVNTLRKVKDNLFYESYEAEYQFGYNSRYSRYAIKQVGDGQPSVSFNILAGPSSRTLTYKRKPISEYISQLSGLVNFAMIIFYAISYFVNCNYFQYNYILKEINLMIKNQKEKERIESGKELTSNIFLHNMRSKRDLANSNNNTKIKSNNVVSFVNKNNNNVNNDLNKKHLVTKSVNNGLSINNSNVNINYNISKRNYTNLNENSQMESPLNINNPVNTSNIQSNKNNSNVNASLKLKRNNINSNDGFDKNGNIANNASDVHINNKYNSNNQTLNLNRFINHYDSSDLNLKLNFSNNNNSKIQMLASNLNINNNSNNLNNLNKTNINSGNNNSNVIVIDDNCGYEELGNKSKSEDVVYKDPRAVSCLRTLNNNSRFNNNCNTIVKNEDEDFFNKENNMSFEIFEKEYNRSFNNNNYKNKQLTNKNNSNVNNSYNYCVTPPNKTNLDNELFRYNNEDYKQFNFSSDIINAQKFLLKVNQEKIDGLLNNIRSHQKNSKNGNKKKTSVIVNNLFNNQLGSGFNVPASELNFKNRSHSNFSSKNNVRLTPVIEFDKEGK